MIGLVTISEPCDAARVGILIRLHIPVRDELRRRVAGERVSMNRYLENLVRRDLNEPDQGHFVPVTMPTFASRGKNGMGRPTKGARKPVILRIEPELRQRIHQRAESLELAVNDYLESLVSNDISAAAATGEAVPLNQIA